jgi:hypothetical protein
MASAITHAVVGVALAQAGRREWRQRWSFWFVAVFCSVLPDIDVVGFRFGIHYADLWGHRGMTHSLLFAPLRESPCRFSSATRNAIAGSLRFCCAGRNDRRRSGRRLFLALRPHSLLLRLATDSRFPRRSPPLLLQPGTYDSMERDSKRMGACLADRSSPIHLAKTPGRREPGNGVRVTRFKAA